jgi:hypothetical protein
MEREAAWSLQCAGPGLMEMREAMAMSLVVALPDQRQARRSARQELVRQVELGATASQAPEEKRLTWNICYSLLPWKGTTPQESLEKRLP